MGSTDIWGEEIHERRVGPLSSRAGASVVMDLIGAIDQRYVGSRKDAELLSDRLGGLPLALRAAGQYLIWVNRTSRLSLNEYRAALDTRFGELVSRPMGLSAAAQDRSRNMVMATWELSLDFLDQQGFREARRLLQILSTYDASPVPITLVRNLGDRSSGADMRRWRNADRETSLSMSDRRLSEVLEALQQLALVDFSEQNSFIADEIPNEWSDAIVVHRLVSEVVSETLNADRREARTIRDASVYRLEAVCGEVSMMSGEHAWRPLHLLEPHLRMVARRIVADHDYCGRAAARSFARSVAALAVHISHGYVYTQGLENLNSYLELVRCAARSRSHVRVVLHAIGHRLWQLNQYDEAERELRASNRLFVRLLWRPSGIFAMFAITACGLSMPNSTEAQLDSIQLQLRIGKLFPDSQRILKMRFNLAKMLLEGGRYVEAEAEFRRIWKVYELSNRVRSASALAVRCSIAEALRMRRNFEDAEAEYRAVLAVQHGVLGANDSGSRTARFGLAKVLRDKKNLDAAETEYRAIWSAEAEALGRDHPSTLVTWYQLAGVLSDLKDLESAEFEYRALLEMQQKSFEPDHADIRMTRYGLGGVLRERGNLDAAEAEYRAVLAAEREAHGPDHRSTLIVRNRLAGVLRDRGEFEEAEAEYRAILHVQREILEPEDVQVFTNWHDLAVSLRNREDLQAAETEFSLLLAAQTEALGDDHPHVLHLRADLARVQGARGHFESAEGELRAVLAAQSDMLEAGEEDIRVTRFALATVLRDKGNLTDAEVEYRAVLAAEQEILGPDHPETLTTLRELTELLRHRGPATDAETE
ncbi:tetratricopeptide repeat protein [Kribbella sp. NBC_00482]|uniref:tetratricopeptide repeat protein n=1 Tax=Kribbella sp. NBC_00482 TaxID=2975968 RepID=UPI002E18A144